MKGAAVRTVVRWSVIGVIGAMVIVVTADGFAQSYAGLYRWALEHKVSGWKAESFPLLVDLFIGIGEMSLFLLALDGYRFRKQSALSWLDLLVPGLTVAAGWTVSLVFNVGHVHGGRFSDQATAAIPPVASMVGLVILLRTLHRYVARIDEQAEAAPAEVSEIRHLDSEIRQPQTALPAPPDPGQGVPMSLDAAVMSARAAGLSVRDASEAFGVTRYRVEKLDKQRLDADASEAVTEWAAEAAEHLEQGPNGQQVALEPPREGG